ARRAGGTHSVDQRVHAARTWPTAVGDVVQLGMDPFGFGVVDDGYGVARSTFLPSVDAARKLPAVLGVPCDRCHVRLTRRRYLEMIGSTRVLEQSLSEYRPRNEQHEQRQHD